MTDDELERLREFRAGIAPPGDAARRTIYAHATRDRGGRRYRLPSVALAAVAAAAGVALLLVSPWNGNGGLVQRALAAVGTGEVLHVVFTQQEEGASQAVSLPSGAELPAPIVRKEVWYDQSRGLEKEVDSLPNGDVLDQSLLTPQADYDSAGKITNAVMINPSNGNITSFVGPPASLEPALTDFVDEYQSALSSGQATQTGTGQVDGHDVIWLHIAADPAHHYPAMDVAIDASTYAPVRIRTDESPAQIDVSEIDTQAYDPSLFTQPPVTSTVSSSTGTPTPIDAAQAPDVLRGEAVWLGQSWNGYQLTSVAQEQVTDGYAEDTGKQPVQSTAVVFTYAAGPDVLQIQESTQCEGCVTALEPTKGVLILGQGPVPSTTLIDGVYVSISQTGGNADPVAVANALQPVGG